MTHRKVKARMCEVEVCSSIFESFFSHIPYNYAVALELLMLHTVQVTRHHSWFHTFAMSWMLYAFFWVIPRHLNFMCRCFRTLCLFHRQAGVCRILHTPTCLWRWDRQSVLKHRHITFRCRGITQKKAYNN